MHPDPAHRPSAQYLATHLHQQYPSTGTRKAVIFDLQSGGDIVQNLMRENAALRAKLAQI